MMYAGGLSVPDGLDGSVIQALFTDEFLAAHPVQVSSAGLSITAGKTSLTAEEERLVEDKLRGLGYL